MSRYGYEETPAAILAELLKDYNAVVLAVNKIKAKHGNDIEFPELVRLVDIELGNPNKTTTIERSGENQPHESGIGPEGFEPSTNGL